MSSKDGEEVKSSASRCSPETVQEKRPLVRADYAERGLNICHFCGLNFNVGERIPRIIVGCGHTFCTSCLSYFLRNQRIRCPMCRKLLKGVDSVDKLPLNFNILYEVVTKDPLLSKVNFDKCLNADPDAYQDDESYERDFAPYMCQKHEQRIKHFYCSEHPSIFCRECIKDLHNYEACFVVDLYEIEKMRKLQQQNNEQNRKQLSRRQDGATQSYVEHAKPAGSDAPNPLLQKGNEPRRPRHEPGAAAKPQQQPPGYFQPQTYTVQAAKGTTNFQSGIVEFDANQFDGQGVSSQEQIMAAQHHQMLLNAGNKNFPQQHFYGQHQDGGKAGGNENSFSDDDTDEHEEEEDDEDDSELNSVQKQQFKKELYMMGYAQNRGFEDDDEDEDEQDVAAAQAFIAGARHMNEQQLMTLDQDAYLQQQQFQEAMRIQMAMKQMPIEGTDMPDAPMGLRVKNAHPAHQAAGLLPQEFDLAPQVMVAGQEPPFEEQLSQQEKFELDKKLFAQQMKEQLLGRSAKPTAKPDSVQAQEEVKASVAGAEQISDGGSLEEGEVVGRDEDEQKSFNSQIELGEAMLVQDGSETAKVELDQYQTPPVVTKQSSSEANQAAMPVEATSDNLKERSKNNEGASASQAAQDSASEAQMKENTAPQGEMTSAQ